MAVEALREVANIYFLLTQPHEPGALTAEKEELVFLLADLDPSLSLPMASFLRGHLPGAMGTSLDAYEEVTVPHSLHWAMTYYRSLRSGELQEREFAKTSFALRGALDLLRTVTVYEPLADHLKVALVDVGNGVEYSMIKPVNVLTPRRATDDEPIPVSAKTLKMSKPPSGLRTINIFMQPL